MKASLTILWCAALMVYGAKLMLGLYYDEAPLFTVKSAMDVCYLALFITTGGIVLFAYAGVFWKQLLWGSIIFGAFSIVAYLAMAARQDTPEHAVPTCLTLILCAVTWGFIRKPGPSAFNLMEDD